MVACRNETWRSHVNGDGLTKQGYHNKAAAKRVARRVVGVKLDAYRCPNPDCGLWHLGKRPREAA